jgi:hypothetical protein
VLLSIDGSVIVAVLIGCSISSSSFQDRTFQKKLEILLTPPVQNAGHPNKQVCDDVAAIGGWDYMGIKLNKPVF